MSTCGTCGGVIGPDFWTGTACACVSKTARHGAALHEALLNNWPFTMLEDGKPLCVINPDLLLESARWGLDPRQINAIKAVERQPIPAGVVIIVGGGSLDWDGNWTEMEPYETVFDMDRFRGAMEEFKTWGPPRELLMTAEMLKTYRLQAAHYGLETDDRDRAEFKRLYECHPLPDKHRYGPHATDPYAPGNRRRRR